MHWDRLFDDLESQLASEWEAERAALDAESERLRISRLDLHSRLRQLCAADADAVVDLADGHRLPVTLRSLGIDWIAAVSRVPQEARAAASALLIPLPAITGLAVDHGAMLSSLDELRPAERTLRERMPIGFVLRDLARRRVPVHLTTRHGDDVHGTIDRAAADHLDLALHDTGESRRAAAVRGFRIVPYAALVVVRFSGDQRV